MYIWILVVDVFVVLDCGCCGQYWSMYMYVSGAIIKLACTGNAAPIVM